MVETQNGLMQHHCLHDNHGDRTTGKRFPKQQGANGGVAKLHANEMCSYTFFLKETHLNHYSAELRVPSSPWLEPYNPNP